MTEKMPQGKETVTDQEIVDAIECHDDPVVAAVEIAEMFEHTRQWAHSRLESLHEEGKVKKKGGGRKAVVWWV